jgi:predicted nucleic acid-binding protein
VTAVLDTSVIVSAFERRESPSRRAVSELFEPGGEGAAVSVLTLAELLRGAAGDAELAERYETFIAACAVHDMTEAQARTAAALAGAADAREIPSRERPGLVDATVAALSLALGARVLTRDVGFYALPGVRVTVLPEADS